MQYWFAIDIGFDMKQTHHLFIKWFNKLFYFGSIKISNNLCFYFELKLEPNNQIGNIIFMIVFYIKIDKTDDYSKQLLNSTVQWDLTALMLRNEPFIVITQ